MHSIFHTTAPGTKSSACCPTRPLLRTRIRNMPRASVFKVWSVIITCLQAAFNPGAILSSQDPKNYFHNEQPIDLDGASAAKASDYQKRPHVFRLKLANGGDYLFQCKDDVSCPSFPDPVSSKTVLHVCSAWLQDEMTTWINKINNAVGGDASTPSRAQTLPAPGTREEPKRRSFFTLSKKK